MRLTREFVRPMPGSSIACLEFDMPEFDHDYHYHPELEITWIVKSEGERLIGDCIETFEEGDLVLIGSNVPHKYRNWKRGRALSRVIQFRGDLFGESFFDLSEFADIQRLMNEAGRGFAFSSLTRRKATEKMEAIFAAENGVARIVGLIDLLSLFADDTSRRLLASPLYAQPVAAKKIARLERVLNYLEKNWQGTVHLEEVAKVAALHPQSLSRFFKQHLGLNFQEYLIQLRLSRSAQALLQTEDTVLDIAFKCGFNNLGNFNKHFRRHYGMPPSHYRERLRRTVS